MGLIDRLEAFVNMQTDWDWGWGPLVHVRPAKNQRMNTGCYLIYGSIVLASPFILIFALVLTWLFRTGRLGHSSLSYFLWTAQWYGTHYWPAALLMPLLSAGATWLYFYFWNRRADRLSRNPSITESRPLGSAELSGVWPPPPSTPNAAPDSTPGQGAGPAA